MQKARLTVELIDKSNNPTIRNVFTNNEAGQEIDGFVKKHHLFLEKEYTAIGNPSGFVLTGDVVDVRAFIETFLSEDAERGVFNWTAKPIEYIWKHDGVSKGAPSVLFDKPLAKDKRFADLRDGRIFKVVAVTDDVAYTFDDKSLSEEELNQLRTKYKFPACNPEWNYVILP